MITEDYVSFEVAKLLKEKGFNEPTEDFYDSSGKSDDDQGLYGGPLKFGRNFWNNDPFIKSGYPKFVTFARPTQPIVLKWLREVHGLIISIEFQIICPTWKWRIYVKSSDDKHTDFQHYNKYEEAVEAAIKYTLENLI